MNAALASPAVSPNDSLWSASLLFPSNTSCLNIRLIEVSIKSGQLQLVPFPPSRAIGLAGTYDIVLVADLGPRVGDRARGVIHLAKTDTLHRYYINAFGQGSRRHGDRPLFGWGELHGDIGLMTAGTPLASRDSAVPGVVASLDSLRGGLRFMLGYRLMLDGGFNELIVTSSDAAGFAGRWESSVGPTTYRAAGYFCARRRASDD